MNTSFLNNLTFGSKDNGGDNMDELKVSKERVLEAASKCATAKQVLSVLFPEVFIQKKTYKVGTLFRTKSGFPIPLNVSTLSDYWILACAGRPFEYYLISLATGFPKNNPQHRPITYRGNSSDKVNITDRIISGESAFGGSGDVFIPREDLEGLEEFFFTTE